MFLLFSCVPAEAWSGCTSLGVRHIGLVCQRKAVFMNEEPETSSDDFSRLGLADDAPPPPPPPPARYDVKKLAVSGKDEGAGAGFNQFDPVLFASGVLSRRFGILRRKKEISRGYWACVCRRWSNHCMVLTTQTQ